MSVITYFTHLLKIRTEFNSEILNPKIPDFLILTRNPPSPSLPPWATPFPKYPGLNIIKGGQIDTPTPIQTKALKAYTD